MSKLLLPALQGHVGDWIFYSCIMPLTEIGKRVSYAGEIHKNRQLSDMIQRELRKGRASEIAEYLATQEQRFFNSLVLAVYDSDPAWHPVGQLEGRYQDIDLEAIHDRIETLGVLELSSSLKMFAIDGQHRLSGIKLLMERGQTSDADCLPVLLVGHKRTAKGLERTRRLFTTLNKTAKKVSKGEIIALDEDDAGAIVVRQLVEEHPYFKDSRIAFQATNNLPRDNRESLTTLGNLYDVSWVILKKIQSPSTGTLDPHVRPSDETVNECQRIVVGFFDGLGAQFPDVAKFFRSRKPERVVLAKRHEKGGHILFRPVGLNIFADLVAELRKNMEFDAAMDKVGKLPVELGRKPYSKILWDPGRGVIDTKGRKIVHDLLRLAVGLPASKASVHSRLAKWLGVDTGSVDLSDWVPTTTVPSI